MICKYCGRTIDDDATSCPYCGSSASLYMDPVEEETQVIEDDFDTGSTSSYAPPERKKRGGFKMPKVSAPKSRSSSGAKPSMPKIEVPNLPLSTIFSILCCLISLICLLRVSALNSSIKEQNSLLNARLTQISSSVSDIHDQLANLDTTVANVQDNAYNQFASQAIDITKDLTSLTGPVTAGKYNQMFIVNAKGNLSINSSFNWQKYNEATKNWVSIVFTGDATSNEEYGLRIENSYDSASGNYISVLWANGITPAAAGTYRCVITDMNNISKNSSEAIVAVAVE